MKALAEAAPDTFKDVRTVLTDMDETLTSDGRLPAAAYGALERLQAAGLKVVVVTAAPAGWCDQMARMWPIDGVIGENGGLFFGRDGPGGLKRRFWHDGDQRAQLAKIGAKVAAEVPGAAIADDQPFRLASLAFARDEELRYAVTAAMADAGLNTTANNLWLLGWFGAYDKLAMTRRVIGASRDNAVCYCGDSENDAPMFRAFQHSIGMSTVRGQALSCYPTWIAGNPGGAGFVEAADAILASQPANALPSASSSRPVPCSREPASW